MKRASLVILFFFVCSATYLTQGLANADTEAAAPPRPALRWPWFPHPWALPPLPAHKWPVLPPLPAHKWPVQPSDPKVTKCWSSFHGVDSCVHDIFSSFWTRKVSIGSDCCKVIQEIDDDCTSNVFGVFSNPFFHLLVNQHCANKPKA